MSEHQYDAAWKRFRQLRLHVRLGIACFVLGTLATFVISHHRGLGWAGLLGVFFWFYLFIAIGRFKQFRCPRCGNKFERSWPSKEFPVRGTCPYCGLPKFSGPQRKSG
jgi:membrane protease YdiL (CAAX protease family)